MHSPVRAMGGPLGPASSGGRSDVAVQAERGTAFGPPASATSVAQLDAGVEEILRSAFVQDEVGVEVRVESCK